MTGVLCKTHVCVRRNDSAGQRGWWRLAWNCIIRLGTSRISMSCIFHEARSRGGNHIAFGSPDAVPSLSLLFPPPPPLSPSRFLLPPWQRATPVFSASSFVFSRVDRFSPSRGEFWFRRSTRSFNETKGIVLLSDDSRPIGSIPRPKLTWNAALRSSMNVVIW